MSTTSISPPAEIVRSDLHFAAGVPGFPRARSFKLSTWGQAPSPFFVLDCQDVAGLRFVAVGPGLFFPSYQPHFAPEVYQAVDAAGRDDVVVMVILTLRSRPEDTTANLLGPLVINAGTGESVQAVLSGSGFSPQTPIVKKAG